MMLLFICGPFSGARRRRSVFTCGYPPSGGCFDDGHCCGQRLIRRWDADSGGCGGAGGVQSPGHLDVQGRRGARGLRRDDPGGADDCGAALPGNEYRPSGAGSAALQRQVAGVEGVGDLMVPSTLVARLRRQLHRQLYGHCDPRHTFFAYLSAFFALVPRLTCTFNVPGRPGSASQGPTHGCAVTGTVWHSRTLGSILEL